MRAKNNLEFWQVVHYSGGITYSELMDMDADRYFECVEAWKILKRREAERG